MIHKIKLFGLLFFLPAILFSCKNNKSEFIFPEDNDEQPGGGQVDKYLFQNIENIFGFYNQHRYSYAPSIVKTDDGTIHVYFCGTEEMVMVDHIYHFRINPDGSQTEAKVVLSPGASGSWDDHHTCDPSVIEGNFNMDGTHYKYALFFLSNAYGVYYNEIGVAFSNDLNADQWIKYPHQIIKKTWDNDGDQLIGGNNKSWGVGQPSAISIDHKGKVLLTYTVGDINGTGVVWSELDLSDMDNYKQATYTEMNKKGLLDIHKKNIDITTDIDFALDPINNKMLLVRPVHPNLDASYPTHIENTLEVASISLDDFYNSTGSWLPMVRIEKSNTGYPRNHNAGIERNSFGEINDWQTPTIYYTVSKASPDVAPEGTKFAEWTYHIWRGQVVFNK